MILVKKDTIISEVDFKAGAMVLIDKPIEWSSFAVVNKMRWCLKHHYQVKKIKVGHAGTLDPLATGLMMIFTGKATKLINDYMGMDKSYDALIKFGYETASYDAEQAEENPKDISALNHDHIKTALRQFEGEQLQYAPIFSALKVKGQPMYKLARKGIEVERKSRTVKMYDINMTKYEAPIATISMSCTKGTYVRSFAHDLGQQLEVGGYLKGLVRTSVGNFKLEDALPLEQFVSAFNNN